MAETAAVLNLDKTVLHPAAGCPLADFLADFLAADDVRRASERHCH